MLVLPSPLAGEGGFSRSEKPGEGFLSAFTRTDGYPSPGSISFSLDRVTLSRKGRGWTIVAGIVDLFLVYQLLVYQRVP